MVTGGRLWQSAPGVRFTFPRGCLPPWGPLDGNYVDGHSPAPATLDVPGEPELDLVR
jgi:hypothetical protein